MQQQEEEIIVVIGSGSIAQAITRRVAVGKTVLLADIQLENAEKVAKTLREAGFNTETAYVDVASRESVAALAERAAHLGAIKGVIHTAGLSPSQATAAQILRVDLFGTALVFEILGKIVARGAMGLVIGSQSAYRLPVDYFSPEQEQALATLAPETLLALPYIQAIDDSLLAYQVSKRSNAFRVQAQAVEWAKRGARINCISAGIIFTPLAYDELNSPERGAFYRNMLAKSPAKRGGTPDEIGAVAEFMFNSSYLSGSDWLIDGGVTSAYKYGELKPQA